MKLPLLFLSGAGLPAWIWEDVRIALDAAPEGPFGVVAHSSGGVVAAELVRLAVGRVAALLGIAAVIPAPGGSFASSLAFPNKIVLPLMLRIAGTRPPESALRKGLAVGVDEETVQRLLADLEPEARPPKISPEVTDPLRSPSPATRNLPMLDAGSFC